MQVDAEKEPEQQEAAADAAAEEQQQEAAEKEQPATASKKQQKPKAAKAKAAAADAPAATGRAKRERKSVEFFVPEVPNREKKAEKPKEVCASLHTRASEEAASCWGVVLSPLRCCLVRVCDDTGRGREDWRHPQQ